MVSKKIQNILLKYLNKQASIKEIEEIERWLNNKSNKKIFTEYVKLNYLINYNFKRFNTSGSQKNLLDFISQQKRAKRIRIIRVFSKYAAAIIVFLGIFYFVKNQNVSKSSFEKTLTESITLKMSDGSVKVLDEKGNFKIKDTHGNELGTQNESTLVYTNKNKLKKVLYNTLTIPYGKRFTLKLSDGTKVNLNAGSSLRYPVKFIEGQNRQVYVETGEAYFNVTKDAKHPFIVSNNNVNVRVLGTQFNISSYPEDINVSTVLVEGSVSLYNSDDIYKSENATLLKPGYLADWNKNNKSIKIEKVDIDVYTAWVNGKIILKHVKFGDVIKKLERHYDVKINNKNKSLEEELITATFDIETIEQVLEVIKVLYPIDYKIKGKTITIN